MKLSLLALLGAATAAPSDNVQQWHLWFAEYVVVPTNPEHVGRDALFIFTHRFVPATKDAPISSVERFDVAGSFDVYKQDGAYFADTLPLFAPSPRRTSISGGEYDCDATAQPSGYGVTCRSVYSGYALQSFYDPKVGITWFEYFCGHPSTVCRYKLAKGHALFRREFLDALERNSDVRTDRPPRGEPG